MTTVEPVFDLDTIHEVVNGVVGDDGRVAARVVAALRVRAGLDQPQYRVWEDEDGNLRIEVFE